MADFSEIERNRQFVQLFTIHARRIFSHILTLAANHDEAEEIFQETSATLWEKFAEFEPGTNFGAWACRVAHFKALSFRSRKQRRPTALSDEVLELVNQEALALSDSLDEQYRALADCYAKLSPADRDLIDRRYQHGVKTADIAANLRRSRLSVYRALAKVHQSLFDCVTRALQDGDSYEERA